ncbi:tyrosine-type recombinase/integrase [Maridesulfovibrio sp.]|uniref:tyrosine-type recombinase/integrase n=1 Tax=unclassified Maridesulfovibrio TaxID=2794999 RepID=UPI003B005E13
MSIHMRKSGSYFVRYRKNGKQKQKSGFGSGEAGKARAEEFDRSVNGKKNDDQELLANNIEYIDQLAQRYYTSDDVDMSKQWRRDWLKMFNERLLPELSQIPISHLKGDTISRLVKQKFPEASLVTRSTYVGYVKAMFSWGVRMELIEKNPLAHFTRKSSPQKDLLVDKELILNIRDACVPHIALGVEFIANTGVRPGPVELLGVKWEHINWKDSTVSVLGKNRKWRIIPLKPEFLEKLMIQKEKAKTDYMIEYNGRGNLDGINQGFRRTCRKIGVDDAVELYDIRHWFCSMLLAKGVPVKTVSMLMDHSSTRMTLDVYGHFIPGDEAQAIQGLPDIF